jgi:hypothetical protein
MTSKYPRVYRKLKAFGFSPAHALNILIDAKRGHDGALITINLARKAEKK